jgi:hypothetical protein
MCHLKNFCGTSNLNSKCIMQWSKICGKWYSCNSIIFKTISMKLDEILNILFVNHENPHAVAMFFNYIKCKKSFKIMRFVKGS